MKIVGVYKCSGLSWLLWVGLHNNLNAKGKFLDVGLLNPVRGFQEKHLGFNEVIPQTIAAVGLHAITKVGKLMEGQSLCRGVRTGS